MAPTLFDNGISLETGKVFSTDTSITEIVDNKIRLKRKPLSNKDLFDIPLANGGIAYPSGITRSGLETRGNWTVKAGSSEVLERFGSIAYSLADEKYMFRSDYLVAEFSGLKTTMDAVHSDSDDLEVKAHEYNKGQTIAGREILIGEWKQSEADLGNLKSFFGMVTASSRFFANVRDDDGTGFFSSAGTIITKDTDFFIKINWTASTEFCEVKVFTDPGFTALFTTRNVTATGVTFTGLDSLGEMSVDQAVGEYEPQFLGGIESPEKLFGQFTTSFDGIYLKIDSKAVASSWKLSAFDYGAFGPALVKMKFFSTDDDNDITSGTGRTAIDAGLNATFLTQTAINLEADQTGQFIYFRAEISGPLANGKEWGGFSSSTITGLVSADFASEGGGDIDTVFKESGTPVIRILLTETFDVTGNLIFNADLTAVQVDINVRRFSDNFLISSLFSGTVDFVANVAKTFATINGGTAPSFMATVADEYIIEIIATHADIQDIDERCGLIVNRVPQEPTVNSVTISSGQVIFDVTPINTSDRVFSRVAEVEDPWPLEDIAFSVLGPGNITVTSLANFKLHTATFYSKFGDLTSDWTKPIFFFIDDGTGALMKKILDAVASKITSVSLVDSESDPIAAIVQIPPIFDNVSVAQVLVFPDNAPLEPERSGLNNNIFRVNVAFCERQKTEDVTQQGNQLFVRERIQALFVGQRLDGLPEVYCQGEVSPFVLDLQEIKNNFNWISAITLEFFTLTVRG